MFSVNLLFLEKEIKKMCSLVCLVMEVCHLPQKLKQAGTLRTQLRTNPKTVVLKLGLLLSQQGSLTKQNFAAEPVSIFAPG